MTPEDLVSRLRTLYLQAKKEGSCFVLFSLHSKDLEILRQSSTFDADMKSEENKVRGHIWGVPVRESSLRRQGLIGVEVGKPLADTHASDVIPWQKAIEGSANLSNKADLALGRIDDLLTWDCVEKCDKELRELDLNKLDPNILVTVLTGASARSEDLPYYVDLVNGVEAKLLVHKNGDQALVDKILRGLREKRNKLTPSQLAGVHLT